MDPTLFELAPQEFEGVIAELGLPQSEADQLRRQYRRQNSMFAGLYGLLDSVAGRDAEQGRVRADVLPMTRPEGMTGIEALLSGNAELAIPGYLRDSLLGSVEAAAMGIDAPAAAYQGMIPAEDMAGEALGTAGMAMTGGGAVARPAGSVGMGGRVVAASESRAQRIARMLREGRGDEITDDMLAALDANDNMELAQLYAAGETGVDMPMDFDSRMARAREMGRISDQYHATNADFPAFIASQTGLTGRGIYTGDSAPDVFDYARARQDGIDGLNIIPLVTPDSSNYARRIDWQNVLDADPDLPYNATWQQEIEGFQRAAENMSGQGFLGVHSQPGERVTFEPRNVRSRFARFDPRLGHLENLNAANASTELGLLALAASAPSEEDQLDQLRAYLGLLNQ